MHIILVKKKQSVKQRNRPISGPIRSDPVIRPDPVNTRTRILTMTAWPLTRYVNLQFVVCVCAVNLDNIQYAQTGKDI